MFSPRTIGIRLISFFLSLIVIYFSVPYIGPLTALIVIVVILTFMMSIKGRIFYYPYKNRNDMVVQEHLKVKSSSTKFSCPSCGNSIFNDDFFCQNCGQKVI